MRTDTALYQDHFLPVGGREFTLRTTARSYFLHSNHLDSTTFVSHHSGTVTQKTLNYPWGERWVVGGPVTDARFAGMDASQWALYVTPSRTYDPPLYRWMSPDEFNGGPTDAISANFGAADPTPPGPLPYADILNPQSLNKYQYGLNNPYRYIDPTGHDWEAAGDEAIGVAKEAANFLIESQELTFNSMFATTTLLLNGGKFLILPKFQSSNPDQAAGMKAAFVATFLIPGSGQAKAGSQLHHIATNKNIAGGFTKQFEKIFAKAGMKLSDDANLVRVLGHRGPHAEKYHEYVLRTLRTATKGLKGEAYKTALRNALQQIGRQVQNNASMLNSPYWRYLVP